MSLIRIPSALRHAAIKARPAPQVPLSGSSSACYSTAASSSSSSSTSSPSPSPIPTPSPTSTSTKKGRKINVSVILSRQPIILRTPTELESTVHNYNHHLSRKLSQPFKSDFYYRQGSAGEVKFLSEEAQRKAEIDGLTTDKKKKDLATAENDQQQQQNKQETQLQERITQADTSNDITSLKRKLDQNLYLLYKSKQSNTWRLPTVNVDYNKSETLHRVAPNAVTRQLGDNLDIWLVTNMPVGFIASQDQSEKTYFMRGHILSGKASSKKPLDTSQVSEYAWLTRDEIKDRVEEEYHHKIVDLL
ncbi:unnamed protein product [Sympodiomycopsis kandeliae]